METEFARDYLMYAAIFGIFGFSWFGWAQEKPPASWRLPLGIASAVSFIIAGIGGYMALRQWGAPSALTAEGAYETFGIVVGVEIISALVGSLLLLHFRRNHFVAPWVAFIVGIHFIPLAFLFHDAWLHLLALLVVAASILSVALSKQLGVSVVTLTGTFTGLAVGAFALRGLALYFL